MAIYRGEFVITSAGPKRGRLAPESTAMSSQNLKGDTISSNYKINSFNGSGSFRRCEKWYNLLKSDHPNLYNCLFYKMTKVLSHQFFVTFAVFCRYFDKQLYKFESSDFDKLYHFSQRLNEPDPLEQLIL